MAGLLCRRGVLTLGITAAIVAGPSGCTLSDDVTPPPKSSSPDVSTETPTQSPSPTPALELKQRQAGEAVTKYWAVVSQLAADPRADLMRLNEVAADQAFAQQRVALNTYRAQGWVQTGVANVSGVRVVGNSSPFTVSACVDVSNVDFRDQAGKSAVATNRPDQQRYSYKVVERASGFLVVEDTFRGKPC